MKFKEPYSSPSRESALSPGDIEALEDIRGELALHSNGWNPDYREIVVLALHRMQEDLDSGSGGDVIEDVRREIVYRQWCARNNSGETGARAHVRSLLHGSTSV